MRLLGEILLGLAILFAFVGVQWLIVAGLRWLGARSPWRRK